MMSILRVVCIVLASATSALAQEPEIFLGTPGQLEAPKSEPENYLAKCLANPDDNISCYLARTSKTDGGLESAVSGQIEATGYVTCNAQGGVCLELATLDLGDTNEDEGEQQRLPSVDITILFEYDSSTVQDAEQAKLEQLARALKDPVNSGASFAVIGHTDAKGSAKYNCQLSERRARAVSERLAALNVPSSRTIALGAGEYILKNTVDSEAGENRRVGFARVGDGPDEVVSRIRKLCDDLN